MYRFNYNKQTVFIRNTTVDSLNGILQDFDNELNTGRLSQLHCCFEYLIMHNRIIGNQNTIGI